MKIADSPEEYWASLRGSGDQL